MEIAQEEVFGPVAPIILAEDEKEAVKIANDSKFGLGAKASGLKIWRRQKNCHRG